MLSKYSWNNITLLKTLINVVLEAPDNNAQEKTLCNVVLILLGQHFATWGSGQHCTRKNLVPCFPKDTHKEKALPNETTRLSKSMNINIWVVGGLHQSLYEVLKLKQKFFKNKVVTGKTPILCVRPILYSPFCFSWHWKYCIFNLSTFNWNTVLQFFEKVSPFSENLFQSWNIKNVQNFKW